MLIKLGMALMVKTSIAAKKNIRLIGETMTEINLLEETERALAHYNRTWDDVSWIGGHDFYISVEQFKEAAKDTNYNCGYGSEEVAIDLVICFYNGSWLSRAEYDGSEWWKYNAYPQKPRTKFEGSVKLADPNGYEALGGLRKLNK
jgi:hypothetical protein